MFVPFIRLPLNQQGLMFFVSSDENQRPLYMIIATKDYDHHMGDIMYNKFRIRLLTQTSTSTTTRYSREYTLSNLVFNLGKSFVYLVSKNKGKTLIKDVIGIFLFQIDNQEQLGKVVDINIRQVYLSCRTNLHEYSLKCYSVDGNISGYSVSKVRIWDRPNNDIVAVTQEPYSTNQGKQNVLTGYVALKWVNEVFD